MYEGGEFYDSDYYVCVCVVCIACVLCACARVCVYECGCGCVRVRDGGYIINMYLYVFVRFCKFSMYFCGFIATVIVSANRYIPGTFLLQIY